LHTLSAIIRAGRSHAETLASIGSNGFRAMTKLNRLELLGGHGCMDVSCSPRF
jgi:hypothetical protein